MSRKILKIGSDVLTLNDKLVSVKEDYPFFKVNQDTSNQYWNALEKDLGNSPNIEILNNPFEIGASNSFGTVNGMIACSNGSIYTIPSGATSIVKITPNLADPTNPTITNIGTFAVTANKFIGAHEVGGKLILIPSTFESIAIIDLFNNDTLSFVGSLTTTANKFGKSSLADNGLIIAPANSSTQHLIFNPETLGITLQTAMTSTVLQNLRGYSVNAGNNMVYMFSGTSTTNHRVTKINMGTLVESVVSTSIVTTDSGFNNAFCYKGVIYAYKGATSLFTIFNTNDSDSRITVTTTLGANVSISNFPAISSDGWVYSLNTFTGNYPNFRINPRNNTIQYTTTAITTATLRVGSLCMGIDGNLYAVNANNKINVYDFNSNVEIVPNRIYSRYNIR